jgi:hypothetical protein
MFNNIKCGGGGAEPIPSWAVYCNEVNGWCGTTDSHKDAQTSTEFDFVANSSSCDGENMIAGSAIGISECEEECREAGYANPFDAERLDVYTGCCNRLSCAQACMSRVVGLSKRACKDMVHTVAAGNKCNVVIHGRRYDVCGPRNADACQVEPTVEGGLHGCEIGSNAPTSIIDPFCWIYNEVLEHFVPYGPGSEVGLL